MAPTSPPTYTAHSPAQAEPPSGFRLPLNTDGPFPPPQQTLPAPFVEGDGHNPVFVGSAIFPNGVHPCKISPALGATPCRVPYGGTEVEHRGRYDLLPFKPDMMEWVPASGGKIPYGRRPIEGGYDDGGAKLYHAFATVNGVRVPGKTGEHLYGANVAYNGSEHCFSSGYEILFVQFLLVSQSNF
ncbi:hypothetical protein BD410DRAFT_717386 [Rickenella mellea]|uniref:Uncharacterized protein n=1 Tax=Rickenella mellea TaxID=50990 RepID=A0A4Y7QE04_9AGAM|nr:hypothetical protein BD410DRAFT_717386 [Rickenella mellea]